VNNPAAVSLLSYIKHFRLTKLKIDRSLIHNIVATSGDACIFKAAIAMAHSLDLAVIAEGVETEAQEKFLQREGCDMVQGFSYGRPLPAGSFRKRFSGWTGFSHWLNEDGQTYAPGKAR